MFTWLKPGWPDAARLIAQRRTLQRVSSSYPLAGRCLNAGCGEGLYCTFLEQFAVTEIVNVDLANTSSLLARFNDPRHRTLDASLVSLPLDDESFDSCLCTEVIEHIQDDNKAVQELARCLRAGGRLLLSVPHPPAPFDSNHVREGYTLPSMTSLLERNGFDVVASGRCFGLWMDWFIRVWRWQYQTLGKGRRNFMPKVFVWAFGYLDQFLPLGHKWDLVVMAVKK